MVKKAENPTLFDFDTNEFLTQIIDSSRTHLEHVLSSAEDSIKNNEFLKDGNSHLSIEEGFAAVSKHLEGFLKVNIGKFESYTSRNIFKVPEECLPAVTGKSDKKERKIIQKDAELDETMQQMQRKINELNAKHTTLDDELNKIEEHNQLMSRYNEELAVVREALGPDARENVALVLERRDKLKTIMSKININTDDLPKEKDDSEHRDLSEESQPSVTETETLKGLFQ
ncbi:chromosome segregation protein SMC [Planoprotostelium fungivorum]|uniref:Chromosome segregation protein SMC n=1 Tax=Planoprotostelium fungivorum TaxID=1890364 RepID=A0A2P6N3U6_9EUKA|nr:chromosome segregation protein SMC [Planoprotostelium fungivorum]